MKFSEYQELSRRTMGDPNEFDPDKRKLTAALGLCGEAGEVGELVKKNVSHGHDISPEKIMDEVSDVLFYCAYLCECYGIDLEKAATHNVEKLKRRYPNGFNPQDSINRKD